MAEYFKEAPRVDFARSGICYAVSGPLSGFSREEIKP